MITNSEKYGDYIVDCLSYVTSEQTFYRFPNNLGASVIYGLGTYGLEVAVVRWGNDGWEFAYDTYLTDDVIGYVEDLDKVLSDIFYLEEGSEGKTNE